MFTDTSTRLICPGRGFAFLLPSLWMTVFIMISAACESGFGAGNGASKSDPKAQLVSRFKSLAIRHLDGSASALGADHWLFQWLDAVLAGGFTGFPIELEEMPPGAGSIAASRAPWGDSKKGTIFLDLDPMHQGEERTTREFVDGWFTLLFEIGNLIAADRLAGLWNQAVLGRISEPDYATAVLSIEIESARIGCALFRALILPVVGDRMPPGSLWKKWEITLRQGIFDSAGLAQKFPGHFQQYSAAYRKARAQRPVGDSGGRKPPP